MFISGACISHSCWKEWIAFFENKGYKTVAPPWPFKNELAEALRKDRTDSKITTIRLQGLLDHYTEIIEKLPEKPILIGHSYGGLITQLLMQKKLGSVGVCINSFPPAYLGYFSFSFLKSISKSLGYCTSTKKTYLMPFKEWQHRFTNKMSFEEQKDTYEHFAIPESKLVIRDLFSKTAKIDFSKKHNPILFLSGAADSVVPSALQYANFKKYKNLHSITCYKEFRDKNHFVLSQKNWENIAEFIANWLEKAI